jgi:hypothetical protein
VPLPPHLFHDLLEGGAVLALQHRDDLRGLAAIARAGGFLCLGGLLGLRKCLEIN